MSPKKFIQIAWVAETIAIVFYTMVVLLFLNIERVNVWLEAIPALAFLIGGQGVAGSAGPLLSDQINKTKKKE